MIRTLPDRAALAAAAAELIAARAARAVERAGRFTIALSGGSTPRPVFERLATDRALPWRSVHVFWGDERCVPPDDAASNYGLARETLLERVPIPAGQVHRVPGEAPCADAAARYDDALAGFFGATRPAALDGPGFDVALQGMGADGHTASLFPGTAALDSERWAEVVTAPEGAAPRERVTLTLPALATARTVIFLVSGEAKAEALRRVLAPTPADGTGRDAAPPGELPAARVSALDDVVWLVDEAAARRLPERSQGR